MIRAVVDSNVCVSALLNPTGHPAQISKAFLADKFVALLPAAVLREIKAVLARP